MAVHTDFLQHLQTRIAELEKENQDLRERLSEMTTLMMNGEALRDKMLFQSILDGAFDSKKVP